MGEVEVHLLMQHRFAVLVPLVMVGLFIGSVASHTSKAALATGLAQAAADGYSPSFTVSGLVNTPTTYTLADLQSMPSETVAVEFRSGLGMEQHSYQGVRLYDILVAAGPQFDSSRKNDNIDWYVHVRATDGYQAVVAWGEFGPGWESKHILVAYAADGQLLGNADGMARLVVPGDQMGGRYVSKVSSVTLLKAAD